MNTELIKDVLASTDERYSTLEALYRAAASIKIITYGDRQVSTETIRKDMHLDIELFWTKFIKEIDEKQLAD